MEIGRRRLLAFGLTGTALLAVGGGLSWLTLGYRLAPGDAAIALSVKELAVVRAIVATLLPGGEAPDGLALGVHQRIDEEVWSAPDGVRADLKAALHLLEHLPPMLGFAGRFSSLDAASREACFARWLTHEQTVIVQAAVGLKQMAMLFAYTRDPTWEAIGYDGPLVQHVRPSPTSLAYAELLASRRTG